MGQPWSKPRPVEPQIIYVQCSHDRQPRDTPIGLQNASPSSEGPQAQLQPSQAPEQASISEDLPAETTLSSNTEESGRSKRDLSVQHTNQSTRRSKGRHNEGPLPVKKKIRRSTHGQGRPIAKQVEKRLAQLEEAEGDEDWGDEDVLNTPKANAKNILRTREYPPDAPKGARKRPIIDLSDEEDEANTARGANAKITPRDREHLQHTAKATRRHPISAVSWQDDTETAHADHPHRPNIASSAEPEEDEPRDNTWIRLNCLVEAYDNDAFRNTVAELVWSELRSYCPHLKPWHNTDKDGPYPGDSDNHRQEREEALAMVPGCLILSGSNRSLSLPFDCPFGCEDSVHKQSVKGTWAVMLACGALTKEQWKSLIYAGKNVQGYDLEASHLCGNAVCSAPFHIIPEPHGPNMRRTSCHRGNRCRCRQKTRCDISPAIESTDRDRLWQKALDKAQAWLWLCPYCDYEVDDKTLALRDLGVCLTQHIAHAHTDTLPVVLVRDSHSPEPEEQSRARRPTAVAPPFLNASRRTATAATSANSLQRQPAQAQANAPTPAIQARNPKRSNTRAGIMVRPKTLSGPSTYRRR